MSLVFSKNASNNVNEISKHVNAIVIIIYNNTSVFLLTRINVDIYLCIDKENSILAYPVGESEYNVTFLWISEQVNGKKTLNIL